MPSTTTSRTANRGFASMDAHKQREIARKGGRAAHEKGTAHEFTADEARAAGRKGGERVSANREHMSRIGRIGGKSSAGRRQSNRQSNGHNGHNRNNGHPGEFRSTAGAGNSPEASFGEPVAQHGGNDFHGSQPGGQQRGQESQENLENLENQEQAAQCPTEVASPA